MGTISKSDRALLARFEGEDDQELARALFAAEDHLREHRATFGRTRAKAHARAAEGFDRARSALADEVQRVRWLAATMTELSPGDLANLGALWSLVNAPGLEQALHAAIDAPAASGHAEPFAAADEGAWQERKAQLEQEVRNVERARALRDALEAQRRADARLAAIGGEAA